MLLENFSSIGPVLEYFVKYFRMVRAITARSDDHSIRLSILKNVNEQVGGKNHYQTLTLGENSFNEKKNLLI